MPESVAVIGAGAAGLAAARELVRSGFTVSVFEQAGAIGGIWNYTDETDHDPTGRSGSRVFGSLYASLRTNLPRDLMAYSDFTFDSLGGGADDWPRFPHHSLVLSYLQQFARRFELERLVTFNHRLEALKPVANNKWQLELLDLQTGRTGQQMFDAVALGNGHYSKPRVPELPDMEAFRGRISHSHNYRQPDHYAGKRVALWGTAASGADIGMEVARVADSVYWCGDAFESVTPGTTLETGVALYPSPTAFTEQGLVVGKDIRLDVDEFIFCTGYLYDFPFLDDAIVTVDDNWVNPLYLDMINPDYPTLGFIGLPYLIVPFPLFELQSKWFTRTLTNEIVLPSPDEMRASTAAHIAALKAEGVRQRHLHKLGERQTDYYNRVADQCGEPRLPQWFTDLANDAQASRLADPVNFRDKPLPAHGPTRTEDVALPAAD